MEPDPADPVANGGATSWHGAMLGALALAAVATLVALIAILGIANHARDRALALQAHSYDVMILARTLSGTIARSEASLGRYVISGDDDQGLIYYDRWRLAGSQLDRLDLLTDDNPAQQPRVDALRAAYDTRGRELALIALSTRYHQNGQALARYYRARNAPALAQIDRLLDDITARQHAVLDTRTVEAMNEVGRSSRIADILAIVGSLLVVAASALGWLTVRAIGERAAARAEAANERARAEELATAVEDATGELRTQEAKLRQVQKMEAVGQLTGGIAHDFNNMLAVVLGGLELASRTVGDGAPAARHLASAREGADRAAALTRRLLAFSREESLKPEPIGPAQLVAGMSDLLDRTLGDAVTVVIDDTAGDWCVRADRVQLENALLNLAVNARDAMNGRGMLTIATAPRTLAAGEIDACPAGDYVALGVTDTGHGMTAAVAERVFEPFFTTKEAGKGTGLGLSQIFALVRQLGGGIRIDTAPQAGTTVWLFLPRDAERATAAATGATTSAPAMAATALRILVVEDDPRVLAATVEALDELGHHPLACGDPLAAGTLLEGQPVDLVMSDVLMPRQTGPEMIAALGNRIEATPVLYVTGFAGEVGADDLGGRPVLRKPFTLTALEQALAEAVGHGGSSRRLAAG